MTALQKKETAFGFEALLMDRIEQEGTRYLSFDVFDTLIFRALSHPHDVFLEAGRLAQTRNLLALDPEEYRELRINAESRARSANPNMEISLAHILEQLPFSSELKKQLAEIELEAENRFSFINEKLCDTLKSLGDSGFDIVLISDMYLDAETLRSTFFRHHPVLSNIPLYVSCDSGTSKKKGKLFSLASQERNWKLSHWLHIGDNLAADVEAPIREGLNALPYFGHSEYRNILKYERLNYHNTFQDNALRIISAADTQFSNSPAAFHLGAFVWGPLLLGFSDWCIDKCLASKCHTLVCLMREAVVFAPLVKLRLKQRSIKTLSVKTLSASRRSTFWAAIDIDKPEWYLNLLNHIGGTGGSSFRSYTVRDFYRDAGYEQDTFCRNLGNEEMRKLDSIYFNNRCALAYLSEKLAANHKSLKHFIIEQKTLIRDYFYQQVQCPISACCIVDLGNGATISAHLASILQDQAKLNLLFYASERIYRFSPPLLASGFFSAHNCQFRSHKILQRSQECIEPLLVGTQGSCIAYQRKGDKVEAVLAAGIKDNCLHSEAFMQGLENYFYNVANHENAASYNATSLEGILARYLNLPTQEEAQLFTSLLHEDNFGSRNCYPVIDDQQISTLRKLGIDHAWSNFLDWRKWQQGVIHWPQAVITLIDKHFLARRAGLLSSDNQHAREALLLKIQQQAWTQFTAYGAGDFFEQARSDIDRLNLNIERIVDKKAESSGSYRLDNFLVTDLESALVEGSRRIAIFSFAFQEDIIQQILHAAEIHGIENVEIISSHQAN